MTNTINELMARIEEDPSLATSEDIDNIISYQRKARSNHELGIKPKRGAADETKFDASELLDKLGMVKAVEPMKRRV